ncbi:MAG: hypothetical protein GF417_05830 [Candidatus Latescibacteria bacterium]|nr:hypothetical protein [bacterium]MBD3423936.1 hypothetical protein [Candidatus Latescibacterota bacterium]
MPEWDLPMKVPISSERFLFSEEIADSSSGIEVRGDTLTICIDGDIESQSVCEDDLVFNGSDSTATFSIGTVELDSIQTECADSVVLSDIMPDLSSYIGMNVCIPETTVTSVPLNLQSEDFSAAVITECEVEIEVHNNLPFPLGPNSFSPEGMELSVYDSAGVFVTSMNIPQEIPPGGKGSVVERITPGSGWIRAPLSLEYNIPVARDTVIMVTGEIFDNASCRFGVTLMDLEVTDIIGKISSQQISETHRIAIQGGNRIIGGVIASGGIELLCSSSIPLGADLSVSIPDLQSPRRSPCSGDLHLPSDGSGGYSEDLAGYSVENHLHAGSPIDSFLINVDLVTEESDRFVHLSSSDEIEVRFLVNDLYFSSVEGYLAADTLCVSRYEENDVADYQGFSGGVEFEFGQLTLLIENELNVENLRMNLEFSGYHREEGGRISDSARVVIEDCEISSGTETAIVLSGDQIVNLLNIYPTDVACSGELIYSGYSDVSVGDEINCGYSLSTPMQVMITGAEPVDFDPDTLSEEDLGEDFQDAAGDDIRSARLTARIVNRSPVGGEALLFVSGDPFRSELYDTTGYSSNHNEFYKSVEMSPAEVNPLTGFAEEAAVSEVEFMLSREELRVFRNSAVRTGLRLYLRETPEPVILRGSDYVEFTGQIEMKIRIKDKDEE